MLNEPLQRCALRNERTLISALLAISHVDSVDHWQFVARSTEHVCLFNDCRLNKRLRTTEPSVKDARVPRFDKLPIDTRVTHYRVPYSHQKRM